VFLHSVRLDPRCREARRDLADAYQMHATLSRAFHVAKEKCPPGEFLWRLEPTRSGQQRPQLLIQGKTVADWNRVGLAGWLARADPPLDLRARLQLDELRVGQKFRFRLRANPSVTRDGKRLGLLRREDQEQWLVRKASLHGFGVSCCVGVDPAGVEASVDVHISQEQMMIARKHDGSSIKLYSVLYDGILSVTDVDQFTSTLQMGIGHGKAFGLGLLSVALVGRG
jgi:CRISPR system Cascade subunit CasE